jgi:hypothetical protein
LVEEGETIGIWLAWQIGAAASERDDATSPSRATTLFWLMSLVAAVAASSAWTGRLRRRP